MSVTQGSIICGQHAIRALEMAERTEHECNGYEWRLAYRLGCALVYAVLAIAAAIRER